MLKGNLLIKACRRMPRASRSLLRLYCRSWGVFPGRTAWVAHAVKRELCAGQGRRTVSLGHGQLLEIDLSTAVGQCVYFDGSYEPTLARFLERTLRRGMTVVDAGANIGELTVRMARLVGIEGSVVAVEASPNTFAALERNIELNKLSNVRPVRAALERNVGDSLFYPGVGSCSLSSSMFCAEERSDSIVVRAINLDSLAVQNGLDRIDMIKMDIEGAEIAALQGAANVLASPCKPIIVAEYNERVATNAGWVLLDMFELLDRHRYSVHVLEGRGAISARLNAADCTSIKGKVDVVAQPA